MPIGLSLNGLDALSLLILKNAGTTADKNSFRGYKHWQLNVEVSSFLYSLFNRYDIPEISLDLEKKSKYK